MFSTPGRGRNPLQAELGQLPTYKDLSKARIQALYADFTRQKQSSPAAFRSNLEWWSNTLCAVAERRLQPACSHALVFRADVNLPDAFRYEGVGKPLSLAAVIAELTADRQFLPLANFLSSPVSVYHTGSTAYWLASTLIGKPLWWAAKQAGLVEAEPSSETDLQRWRKVRGDYVILPFVEQAAERIVDHQATVDMGSVSDTVYSWNGFKDTFGSIAVDQGSLTDEDVKVVVKFLERDRHALVSDKSVVKFLTTGSSEAALSPVDVGIVELKDVIKSLQLQIDGLHSQMDSHKTKAAEAVRAKRLPEVARSHLIARKQLEEVLRRRLGVLDNIRSTLLSIEGAAADIQIMKSYESSAATLKAILAHPSLRHAHVNDTMDTLAQLNADAREVDDAIRLGGQMNMQEMGTIDEDEIQRELVQLAQESTYEQGASKVVHLPSVPDTQPISMSRPEERVLEAT